MADRGLRVTDITSRRDVLPLDDGAGTAAVFGQVPTRPRPAGARIDPPFSTDHGLHLDVAERMFINRGCTFLDHAGPGSASA